jgi:Toprim domain/CHC2 zinc finger
MSAFPSNSVRIEQARDADILDTAVRVGARLKKVASSEWAGPCPSCGGKDRFSVNITRKVFNCRGYGGGDAIAMVRHVLAVDFADAVEFLTGSAPHNRAVVARPSHKPPILPVSDVDHQRRRLERVEAIWKEGQDPQGTIVENPYLAGRNLRLGRGAVDALRFHPRCPWRDPKTQKTIFVPAMICAMRSIVGDTITAIHRTRLTADGKKVDRRMLGVASGAAIKLDRDDTVTGGLHIAEGVETAMAARQLGLRPTWALGSTSFISSFPVLPGIECLTILAENDDASAKAVETCAARWHAAGRVVLINRPVRGKDLNDAIRGAA